MGFIEDQLPWQRIKGGRVANDPGVAIESFGTARLGIADVKMNDVVP